MLNTWILCHCVADADDCFPNPCNNGGSCTDRVNGYRCECAAGYDGRICDNGETLFDVLWEHAGTVIRVTYRHASIHTVT